LAWCWVNELHGKAAAGFSGVSLLTVYKWYKVFRGVAENVVENMAESVWGSGQMGGPGFSVQVI